MPLTVNAIAIIVLDIRNNMNTNSLHCLLPPLKESKYVPTKEGRITASQMLERFLFDPAMQYTPVEKLSGGEKRRLYLLKVLMEAPNVLLLDEPGNDLDIPTMTILEDYLDSFSGIVITVSHDRYFLDNVVNRIMAFEGDGRLVQYEGGYTDYLEAKERKGQSLETRSDMNGGTVQGETAEPEKKKSAADTWKQNRKQKLKFTYKEQKEFDTIDFKTGEVKKTNIFGLNIYAVVNQVGQFVSYIQLADALAMGKMINPQIISLSMLNAQVTIKRETHRENEQRKNSNELYSRDCITSEFTDVKPNVKPIFEQMLMKIITTAPAIVKAPAIPNPFGM